MDLSEKEKEPVENRTTIQILKDTAKKCKLLIDEADKLLEEGDSEGYKGKLIERAELIRKLPKELVQATDIGTEERREEILNVANLLALSAEKALEPRCEIYRALGPRRRIYYELSVLMGPESGETGDPNPLDVLIESIKE